MKKVLIAVISIALVVFLSFGAYADIIQPNATQFELGYSLSTSQNTIMDIVQFSALPYTYNAQLMFNGNNNALYTYGLYNISGFTDSDQIATSYNFVGGQSYEVTYRFSMQFADNSLASYLEYIDPQLIGINAYFTNDPLASFTNGMPSSTIATYSSNYSAAITNETVVSSHDPDIAGTVSFDVVLLFKLNLNYSGSFHKILLNLDFHNFATAIPSGNSGFFYCQLNYQSISNVTEPSWNNLTFSYRSGYSGFNGNIYSTSYSSYRYYNLNSNPFSSYTDVSGAIIFYFANNSYLYYPSYSYSGSFDFLFIQYFTDPDNIVLDNLTSIDLYLSTGNNPLPVSGSSSSTPGSNIYDVSSFPDYQYLVSYSETSRSGNAFVTPIHIDFSFTVPSGNPYFASSLVFIERYPSIRFGVGFEYVNSSGRIYVDRSGTLLSPDDPENPDDPVGGDDSGGSVDLSGVESGIQNIEDLINGDGSYGSPESGPIRDLDEHLLAEEEFADEFGFDSYFNDDFLDNLMDEADWENIDTPTQDSAFWVHKILNPVMDAFPVFVVFPLMIGLVATFLGRRYQL